MKTPMHTGNSRQSIAPKTPKPPMAHMSGGMSRKQPAGVTANAAMRKNPGKK